MWRCQLCRAARSLRRLLPVSQPLIELVEQRLGRFRDHGARGKDRLGAGTLEFVVVLRRHHAPDHDHDVVAPLLDEGGLELRNEREMRRREGRYAEHVNVVLDGRRAASAGVANSGPMSTSKPRSAKAVAITFCPRSWPSWPILATKTRGRRPSLASNSVTSFCTRATASDMAPTSRL